jgi:hypothetical protein
VKEVIVEYVNAHGNPSEFHTGYFENGGAGYDAQLDEDFVRVWSPNATTLFARTRVISLTAIEEHAFVPPTPPASPEA